MRPLLPRLELRNVSKTYGDSNQPVEVLHDISLTAEAGSITALVGRSGCGKTTLLNLAGAMDFPTSGEVLIDGRSTGSLNDRELTALRRTRVGFVFQFFQLLPTLTVLENVELPLLRARQDCGDDCCERTAGGGRPRRLMLRVRRRRHDAMAGFMAPVRNARCGEVGLEVSHPCVEKTQGWGPASVGRPNPVHSDLNSQPRESSGAFPAEASGA